ncbi:MAG: hypothetical protein HYY06_05560 [Deltaproteobacteria bacterium]|nr:hypothetical protein [Deltaproteobacteria bacterium]
MHRFARALHLAVLLTVGAPSGATAQQGLDREVDRLLADGRRLYGDQEYPAVIQAMRRALDVPGISPADQLEAYEYIGCSYVALEDEREARRAFRELLVIDPYYLLREPSGSPKIREAFERVRHEIAPDAALRPDVDLRLSGPVRAAAGGSVEVRVEPSGPVQRMTLRTRVAGTLPYDQVPMTRSGTSFRAMLDLPDRDHPYSFEYYVEARDERGRVVARGASPLGPRTLDVSVAAPPPSRWYESPWVWVGAGAAVVGAVVLGVLIGSADREPQCGSLEPRCVLLSLERR